MTHPTDQPESGGQHPPPPHRPHEAASTWTQHAAKWVVLYSSVAAVVFLVGGWIFIATTSRGWRIAGEVLMSLAVLVVLLIFVPLFLADRELRRRYPRR